MIDALAVGAEFSVEADVSEVSDTDETSGELPKQDVSPRQSPTVIKIASPSEDEAYAAENIKSSRGENQILS